MVLNIFFWWCIFQYNKVPCYSIGRENWFGCLRLLWENIVWTCELKCSCYDWCFFNITRFTKNHICFFKQRGNWRAKPVRSLTKIFCRVDDNLTQLHLTKYNICNCTTNPIHGLFAMMGFIIMPIDQQIGTVGENKFKGQVRTELRSTFVAPK